MNYTISRKSKTPKTATNIIEQGYNCYIDINLEHNYSDDMVNNFPLSVLSVIIEKHTGEHNPYMPHSECDDCVSLMRKKWYESNDRLKDSIYSDFKKMLYSDELFNEILYGDGNRYDQLINEHVNDSFNKLYLNEYEVKHFKERIHKTSNLVRGVCVDKSITLFTNLIGLINEYRDVILITTPRQPARIKTINEYSNMIAIGLDDGLCFEWDNANYSEVDKFRLGFKNENDAKEFVEKLNPSLSRQRSLLYYHKDNLRNKIITINVCSNVSDKLFDGLSSKSYGVFLSKRVKPLTNNVVGYITIESKSLNLNGNGHILNDISEYIKERVETINKYSRKWSLPNVEVEYTPIRFYYSFCKDDSIYINDTQVDIINHRPTNFCNVAVGNFVNCELLEKKLKQDFVSTIYNKIISYKIHVPINTGVDINSYQKLLNYAKLTKMNVVSLMLLPHCVGEEYQNTLLNVLDKLVD